jgi:hypothetical protein
MVRRPSRRAYIGQRILLVAALMVASSIGSDGGDNLAHRNMTFGFEFTPSRAVA